MNLPHSINNDNDLKLYESFLKKDPLYKPNVPEKQPKALIDFKGFLKSHIGHVIKAEFPVGSRLEYKVGKLHFVGNDYLELTQNGGGVIAVLLDAVIGVSIIGTFNK